MKIKVNHGSKGEVFCCSVKKAKELFRDTEVYLDFGYLGKYFKVYGRETHFNYVHKNVKGKVLCEIIMRNQQKEPKVILSFYLLKEANCTKKICDDFEKEYLPKLFEFYNKNLYDNSIIKAINLMIVELVGEKLKLHETKI